MKSKNRYKRIFLTFWRLGIVGIFLSVAFFIIGNATAGDNTKISKADYSSVDLGGTNFGDNYGLSKISASDVYNTTDQELLLVSSSFYNYRYDNEIKKGWRDQGIQGELSGIGNPYTIFNKKLDAYYKSNNIKQYGLYEGNFYNYWQGSYSSYQWCLDNYTGFYWAQNIANRKNYNAACQGLVGDTLVDFAWTADTYNPGDIVCKDSTVSLPYFNRVFLEQKYASADEIGIGVIAEHVGFPFRYEHDEQKGSHYVFNSKYDVVKFKGSEATGECGDLANTYEYYYGVEKEAESDSDTKPSLNYYYNSKYVVSRQNKTAQFLPFNKGEASVTSLDFGYGLRLDIPFYLTEDGCQTYADGGQPMKFNFEGDDDVWIFLDGKLVLDLGGAHAKTRGYIDFSGSTDTIKAYAAAVAYKTDGTTTTGGTNNFESGNTTIQSSSKTISGVAKDAVHILTVFYMERGMIESNLYMDFNFIPHNEPIDPPVAGDTVKTDSEMTVRTKIDFSQVANAFKAKVKDLAEDDAFRYKIENVGTGTGNIQDSGIEYPSELLSVRENEGKRTYWSFGKRPKIRIYFDLEAAQAKVSDANTGLQNGTVSGDNAAAYRTTWSKPYITVNNVRQEMILYKDNIYYFDVNKDDEFYFTSDQNVQQFGQPAQSISSKASGEIYINGKTYDYTFVVENGVLYKPVGFKNNRQNGFVCASELANENHPANATSNHSMNLPYQTKGSSSTFVPTSETEYNPVASTTYNLTEAYPATTESYDALTMSGSTTIHIFENNQVTSGKTDVDGIFSLLDGNSATFLKQFRMDSNMRIVTQEYLGKMVRSDPTGQINGNNYVSYATIGTRKTKNYYYTTEEAINLPGDLIDERTVKVNISGDFKFSNVPVSDTETFTSSDKITIKETFTNQVKTGNLCIYKEVTGMKDGGKDQEYSFTVKFQDVFGVEDGNYVGYALEYVCYNADGTQTEGTLDVDAPVVKLKPGEHVVIEGIPVGTKYQIIESNTSDSVAGEISVLYKTKIDGKTKMTADTGDEITITTGREGTIAGIIPESVVNGATSENVNEFDQVDIHITFINQKGVIRLEKLARGEWKNFKDEEYVFTIVSDDPNLVTYTYDIYQYNEEGEEEIAKDEEGNRLENIPLTNGKIAIKATQWAYIQDIPLSVDGYTYTITEDILKYFKVHRIDVNRGSCVTPADTDTGTIKMQLSYKNSGFDVTYVNRYDPSYVTIYKYVDNLYYENKDGTDKTYAEGITYGGLTGATQSFIFVIEEYKTQADAESGSNVVKTFQISIPIDDSNKLQSELLYNGNNYFYRNAKTINVALGKWYRIYEDTGWSWKYDLQEMSEVVVDHNGSVSIMSKYAIFEGGVKNDGKIIPVINFYNILDETKLSVDGDTDVVINEINP
ncbi:MAG: fibro-slime domain-containing protein [Lachnospiraceae bacterium]|nr:fibro-slime domain-containing protein [Lachnospiraceae bacterium]